jgi:surface polysaccharide O-acyltransferase-like enzyme
MNSPTGTERNITLDYFKVVLSILVITIHIPYLDSIYPPVSWYLPNSLARIAVPCFFLINGYFFSKKMDNTKAVKKYLIHLFIIYTVWFIIYLRPYLFQRGQTNILEYFTIDSCLDLNFWGYIHLWYLPALIAGVVIIVLLRKIIKSDTVIFVIAIMLFITGCFLEPAIQYLHYARNGLFFGFPFVFLGCAMNKIDIRKLKTRTLLIATIAGFILLSGESFYTSRVSSIYDMYISLLVFCPAIFLLILKLSIYRETNTYYSYLGPLSSAIYFAHVYVMFKSITLFEVSSLNRFIFVLFITIPVAILIIFINKRIKIFL